MNRADLVKSLERALLLARNDKVEGFVAVIWDDKERYDEIIEFVPGRPLAVVGAVSMLLRDVQTMCPIADLSEEDNG